MRSVAVAVLLLLGGCHKQTVLEPAAALQGCPVADDDLILPLADAQRPVASTPFTVGTDSRESWGVSPLVMGALDRQLIEQAVQADFDRLMSCGSGAEAGVVVIRFFISAQGTVQEASVEASTIGDPELESCLAGRVLRLRFPATCGGMVRVSYPFRLAGGGNS